MLFVLLKLFVIKVLNKANLLSEDNFNETMINFIKDQGIVFIKFAQIISSRNDMNKQISVKLRDKLRTLQDKCFIDQEYEYYQNINYLNYNPISAGSIASVFLIKHNNETCILKKTHTNIKNKINLSIENLKLFLKFVKFFNGTDFTKIINLNEYKEYLKIQTKLDIEAKTQKKFFYIFKDYQNIDIPLVKYYNQDAIIMEYKNGDKLDIFIEKYPNHKNEAIAIIYASMIIMVKNKCIHGDFHFGNFLFKLNNENNIVLTILDFGICCKIDNLQSKYLLNSLNPKNSNEKINKNLFNFINTFNTNEYFEFDLDNTNLNIIDILFSKNIILPSEIISFFTTLQILIINVKTLKREDKNFNAFLTGYLLENDYL